MIPFTRIVALLMAAVLCFGLLVPWSLQRGVPALAIVVALVFFAYLAANIVIWQRMRRG